GQHFRPAEYGRARDPLTGLGICNGPPLGSRCHEDRSPAAGTGLERAVRATQDRTHDSDSRLRQAFEAGLNCGARERDVRVEEQVAHCGREMVDGPSTGASVSEVSWCWQPCDGTGKVGWNGGTVVRDDGD